MQPAQRIELEDNDLAAATMETVGRIRAHAWSIAAVVGLLFAALGLWTAITGQQTASRGASWRAGLAAARDGNPAALAEVIRLYPGTPAADWAELTMADLAFEEGADLLFTIARQPGRGPPGLRGSGPRLSRRHVCRSGRNQGRGIGPAGRCGMVCLVCRAGFCGPRQAAAPGTGRSSRQCADRIPSRARRRQVTIPTP